MTRRDLLKYGVAGSAVVLLGPLAASSASASARARVSAAVRSSNAVKRGGTLRFARSIGSTTLDPANTIIAGDIYTLDKILEPLYVTNPAGQLVPWLATGYELSTDHRTFTFSLRPGVKFSNGKPLVADDVVFSINRTRKDAAGPLSFLDYAITDIEAKGTDSVVFQLSQPWAPFLSDLSVFANAVLPADFAGQSEKDFFTAPIGTGPFTLDGFTPDANSLTLKANPNYWQAGKPYLDAVEFLYVDNDNQRVLQIQGGQVDIIDTVPPANVSSLKASSGLGAAPAPAPVPGPLFITEPEAQGRAPAGGRSAGVGRGGDAGTDRRAFGPGGDAVERGRPLPPRVLGRAAPAFGDWACPGGEAIGADRRRAGERPRRLGSGDHRDPAGRTAR